MILGYRGIISKWEKHLYRVESQSLSSVGHRVKGRSHCLVRSPRLRKRYDPLRRVEVIEEIVNECTFRLEGWVGINGWHGHTS